MFAIVHQIQNLCWFADNYAERIESLIEPYYTAVDPAWPDVYGSLAVSPA